MRKYIQIALLFLLAVAGSPFANAQQAAKDTLYTNFVNPGNAARPRVWWHWMNGNITKDGIQKDLTWMSRSGIGGFQNFDAGLTTPQIVAKRLTFMTPDWKDAFHYAAALADSLQLEMAIAGSPGWSESGGPWVPARDGMKKIVWQEVRVKGGQPFTASVPKPPATTGMFQNLPLPAEANLFTAKTAPPPEYYEDIAVIAYRVPAADVSLAELAPKITSSGGGFTLQQLSDGDLAATNLLPSDTVKGYAWIQYEFIQPQTIKAITVVGGGTRSTFGMVTQSEERSLEVSDDGANFRSVTFLPLGVIQQQTIAITPTTARYFRVTFKNPPPPMNYGALMGGGEAPKAPAGTDIAEVALSPVTRINHFEEKAGFAAATDLPRHITPATTDVIAEGDVIDVTNKMNADGTLNWTPPAGNWKIVRFGYSLTGKQNHPASPEATGLEVDKMDAAAVKHYFENYLNQYKDATGGLMGAKGLKFMVTDSYEAGQETWTPQMAQEFQKRRGYSLLPWMPVLTGAIIKSTEASEQFLWDWRKTISELIAEHHYDQLTDILAQYGMKRYSESHENGRTYIVDGMDVKRRAAVPMSAMWTAGGSSLAMAQADIRESASVAHIYGQNLVAAESLTAIGFAITGMSDKGAWAYYPGNLKPTADLELASGLNRFVIHTSVHQPTDDKVPGLGLGPFGQWFNRHETWADQAKSWTDYLARSSYLLQQGKFVADVVYYYGEDNNITALFGSKLPDVPEGYNYDFINADALINLLSVKDGNLVTPSGMTYRVLVLDSNASKMSLPVLRKINALVRGGATVTGIKPEMDASLTDNQQEFQQLVNETWSSSNAKVTIGKALDEVLSSLNIQPDFGYQMSDVGVQQSAESSGSKPAMLFVHRRLSSGDLYWVNNRSDSAQQVEATFRVSGKMPQLWHAETGKTEDASYSISNGATKVALSLTPNDAVFVLFKSPAAKTSVTLPPTTEKVITTVDGSWKVAFQPGRGAPATATFDRLVSYTENGNAGIKYFSGTATYTKTISVPANGLAKGAQLWLDLGDVNNLAEVTVNGKPLGVIWKKPYRVDVTNALKAGANEVEIKVVNLWVNRLIGDAQPGVTNKITYTSMSFYQANSPLKPSGLLGPVQLIAVSK